MHPSGTRTQLPRRGFYAITDGPRPDLVAAVEAVLRGGATLLQYRDKTSDHERRRIEASILRALAQRFGVPLIINDDIELAATVGADGVHLGAEDVTVAAARARLGAEAIIGVSCYASLTQAKEAAAAGADYLAFGAFFPTPTKPNAPRATTDLLVAAKSLGLPLTAIGGITPDNARALVAAGADFIAAIAGVFGAADAEDAARKYAHVFAPKSDHEQRG